MYGTLLEDGTTPGAAEAFGESFRRSIKAVCELGARRSLLARQRHLAAVSPSDLDELARRAEPVEFEDGAEIVVAGAPADAFYVLIEGSARVITESPNHGRVLRSGEGFGEAGLFGGGVRTATVVALEKVRAVRIGGDVFREAFHGDELTLRPVRAIVKGYDLRDHDASSGS